MNKVESLIKMQQEIAHTIKVNKGNIPNKRRSEYEKLRKEISNNHGIQFTAISGIKKMKNCNIPKLNVPIKDNQSKVSSMDNMTEYMIDLLIEKENSTCIGRAHTIIKSIQDIRKERRQYKKTKCKTYTCKTARAWGFVFHNNIDTKKLYMERGFLNNKHNPHLYKLDILHLIEITDNMNLNLAHKLSKELIRAHKEAIRFKLKDIRRIYEDRT